MQCAPPTGGYPDTGNGFYSRKLSYRDWFLFAVERQTYQDFVDSLTVLSFSALVAGIAFDYLTICLLAVHIVTRLLFEIGVRKLSLDSRVLQGLWHALMGSQICVQSLAFLSVILLIIAGGSK